MDLDQGRKRLGLIQFWQNAETNLVRDWSMRRRPESYTNISFQTHPQMQLKDWTNAWQWSSLEKNIIKFKNNCYCMPSGLEKSLTLKDCKKYFKIVSDQSWISFDDYKNHIRTINYVDWVTKDWIKSKCSCVFWAKNYYCHHVVGLAVYKGRAIYQEIHMSIPIGQTRPRGQPKKTAKALTKQQGETKSSESLSESSDSDPPAIKKVVKKKAEPKKRGRKPKISK